MATKRGQGANQNSFPRSPRPCHPKGAQLKTKRRTPRPSQEPRGVPGKAVWWFSWGALVGGYFFVSSRDLLVWGILVRLVCACVLSTLLRLLRWWLILLLWILLTLARIGSMSHARAELGRKFRGGRQQIYKRGNKVWPQKGSQKWGQKAFPVFVTEILFDLSG
jgi:hypothetical protein